MKIRNILIVAASILFIMLSGCQQQKELDLSKKEDFEKINMFGTGVPNVNYAKYFTGNSFLNPLTKPGEAPVFLANVTFEPGCRTHWHIHQAEENGGQMLVCTAGEGWYQAEGEEAVSLKEGSFIYIPAGVKHWHGAKANSWFSHISVSIPGTDSKNEWLEPVSDEAYNKIHQNM